MYKHNVGDESEAVAPIIWLYQAVDARKEEVFFPDLLITLLRHEWKFGMLRSEICSTDHHKELTVNWSTPNSLIRSYLQPCTNTMLGDESEAVAPIIWLYQGVDARKEEVFFPDLLITLWRHEWKFGMLRFEICSTDHNKILHMSQQ